MTKAQLISEICEKTGVEKTLAAEIVEAAMRVIKNRMAEGENIYLRGFGSFTIKRRAQKVGRIISKNKTIIIPEHSIPAFKPAKSFASRVKDTKVKAQEIED